MLDCKRKTTPTTLPHWGGALNLWVLRHEKRLAIGLAFLAALAGTATYATLSAGGAGGQAAETVTRLLALDLVILLGLAALVTRRVAVLFAGQRRGKAASHLHVRLVYLFSLLATAPAILMVLFSTFFFHLGVESWFSTQVRTAVGEAQAVAEAYLNEHRGVIRADMLAVASDIDREAALLYGNEVGFSRFLDTQTFLRNFSEAVVFDGGGRIWARGGIGLSFDPSDLPPAALETAREGEAVVLTPLARAESDEKGEGGERIQALMRLNNFPDSFLFVSRAVDETVLSYVAETRDASANYAAMESKRAKVQMTFFSVFLVVSLLLLMTAIWAGLYFARSLVSPIEKLIEAAEQVQAGNLSTRVPEEQNLEEFSAFARTFNRMTGQLEQQRRELVVANHKLDERRRFTETILAGVTSGVIAVDNQGAVRLVNEPASRILGRPQEEILGRSLTALFPGLTWTEAEESTGIRQMEMGYARPDHQQRTLLLRLAQELRGEDRSGVILTFDDITELQSAQRKAAWSDVARRVAHEIKNPLTPIQLSAERLRRRFLKAFTGEDQTVFNQCVETIIRHVGDIGCMVAEFAAFARMPDPSLREEDLGGLVRELVDLHQPSDPGIILSGTGLIETEKAGIPAMIDAPQLRQALTNLILNAIQSVERRRGETPEPQGKVIVDLHTHGGQYVLSIRDNGQGFPKGIPLERLTEPYVTYRDKGTGLGLAIVKKIVEDHKGTLWLDGPEWLKQEREGEETGALVCMILPIPLEERQEVLQDKSHAA